MIIEATNCNRTYAAKAKSLAADFVSEVVDFKDMPMGVIHILWSSIVGTLDCSFKFYASAFPDVSSFDPEGTEIDGSLIVPHNASGSRIWIRDRLSFRYLLVRYTANNVTAGVCDIVALGKKS